MKDVAARWPADAVEVRVDGERRWALDADVEQLTAGPARTTRLLGPFDPYLQTPGPGPARPRPRAGEGPLARAGPAGRECSSSGEVAGTWRPRKTGRRLGVQMELWRAVPLPDLEEQAARLAEVRGAELAGVDLG